MTPISRSRSSPLILAAPFTSPRRATSRSSGSVSGSVPSNRRNSRSRAESVSLTVTSSPTPMSSGRNPTRDEPAKEIRALPKAPAARPSRPPPSTSIPATFPKRESAISTPRDTRTPVLNVSTRTSPTCDSIATKVAESSMESAENPLPSRSSCPLQTVSIGIRPVTVASGRASPVARRR